MRIKRKKIDKIRKQALVSAEKMASTKTYLNKIKQDGVSVDSTHYRLHEAQLNYYSGEKDALYEVLSILGVDLRIMPGV